MARGQDRLEKKQARARRRVIAGARVVAKEAAAVARSAVAVANETTSADAVESVDALQEAVAVVQEAAAVVHEAAGVVASAAAAATWPDVERRSKPRLPSFRKHDARVEWKHVAIYVPLLLVVIFLGVMAIWSFLERQSLVLDVVPLPKVTVVTANPTSRLAASWVRLLNDAELQSTLVTADKLESPQGVIVLCDIWSLPPSLSSSLDRFLAAGGSVIVTGAPPVTPLGGMSLSADSGLSDNGVKLSETASPLLARLTPGAEVSLRPAKVAFLKETPRMAVDARWRTNARAAVMHIERDGTRYVWFGVDPDALPPGGNNEFTLLVRTAFRWARGEAISDGAVGAAAETKAFTPQTRRHARDEHFAFSVDRLRNHGQFSVRLLNRGAAPLENPTVKVWLPPGVRQVGLAGDWIMRRDATLTGIPEEGACLIALPSLERKGDRVLKLKIVEQRPPRVAPR
jgi:hypothetical protein